MNLLYDSTRDGFEKFHQKCDGKINIVMIVQTEKGIKFGSYTSEGFKSSAIAESIFDEKAYIFSVSKREVYPIK